MRGYWCFGPTGPYTDVCISPTKLYQHGREWSDLAAELILEQPTGGVIGERLRDQGKWIRCMMLVANALKRKEAYELPVSEIINPSSFVVWGPSLWEYPEGAEVTIFTPIHTLGDMLTKLKMIVEARSPAKVTRAIALIDRNPEPTQEVAGVPFSSVVHLPLPLYQNKDMDRVKQAYAGGYGAWFERDLDWRPLPGLNG